MNVERHFVRPVRTIAFLRPSYISSVVKAVIPAKAGIRTVNVVFVGSAKIRQLNRRFLNARYDTDVIAFPYENGGDVYICLPMARFNARRYNEPFKREVLRLIVHGALHLLGYKDYPAREKNKMWKIQEKIVNKLWK